MSLFSAFFMSDAQHQRRTCSAKLLAIFGQLLQILICPPNRTFSNQFANATSPNLDQIRVLPAL